MTITFRNKEKLYAKLAKLAPAASKALVALGGKSSAEMVQMARALVPVRTGKLRDSIQATPPGGQVPDYAQGGVKSVPAGAWMVTAGNDHVRYAHLIEFGAAPHVAGGRFEGAAHPGNRPQPFFWPSYRATARRHKNRAGRAISQSIKEVARS